jgi:hypothetical protein
MKIICYKVRVKIEKICNKVRVKLLIIHLRLNKCKQLHLFKRKSVILTTKYEGYGKGVVEKFISMEG